MITVESVPFDVFMKSNVPVLFHDKDYARQYYYILFNNAEVGRFSAQSEISPIVEYLEDAIAIGCDQFVIFINCNDFSLLSVMNLPSFFYYFKLSGGYFFVICEVDIIMIEPPNFTEAKTFNFVSYIDHVDICGKNITVSFLDGSKGVFII
ncbi:hypothetical protein AB1287_15460 [Enterobacter asburiae]|uniref:hypothetical protein n=1 Tax=Scandinavium sp. UTDF21-P1B TaxID=3446379 RepID=UPI003497C918